MRIGASVRLCRLRKLTYAVCLLGATIIFMLLVATELNHKNSQQEPIVDVPDVIDIFDPTLYQAQLANTTGWSEYDPTANDDEALRSALSNGSIQCWRIRQVYPDEIPPIVHFTSKRGVAMERHVPYLRSWNLLLNTTANSRFRFMHWSDEQLDKLIKTYYPTLYRVYRQLSNGLERSDIGRLVVVHHVGGVYADLDVELRRDLSQLLTNYSAIWSQEPMEHAIFLYDKQRLISNALIISSPGEAFLTYVLQRWPAWFQRNWAYKKRTTSEAVFSTGPMMLDQFFDKYLAELSNKLHTGGNNSLLLAEPDMFQPIWDVKYLPQKTRVNCKEPGKKLPMKEQICKLLEKRGFATKRVPAEAYTVHWYLHTSYSKQKDKKVRIAKLLPLSKCAI